MKKVIVVTGALEIQGGSVIRAMQTAKLDEHFHIRGITRNASSKAAQKLGVEWVEANLDDIASIEKVFTGAYAAFLLTNFWEPNAPSDIDYIHGRGLVGAAISCKLEYIIWSSLPDK